MRSKPMAMFRDACTRGIGRRFNSVALCSALAIVMTADPLVAADRRISPDVGHYDVTPDKHNLLDQYLKSEDAARYLARFPDMVLIDVRPARYVGPDSTPPQAAGHVPLLVERDDGAVARDGGGEAPDMRINPAFVGEVRRIVAGAGRDTRATVMLICGSGMFSARAADLLAEAGFPNVYSIIDGMKGLELSHP